MKTFVSLNRQLFRQKKRYADLILAVQAFAVIFLFILSFLSSDYRKDNWFGLLLAGDDGNLWSYLLGLAIFTTVIGDLIFAGLMCWQDEKIDNSQTFQLLPFSTDQVWLTNIFSSLLSCVYIFIIQLFGCWLLLIPVEISQKHDFFKETGQILGLGKNDFWNNLQALEYLVVLTLLILIAVTLVNYASQIIIEQLPISNTRWLRLLIIALMVILGLYLTTQINDHLTNYYLMHTNAVRQHGGEFIYDNLMWLSNLEIIIADLILGGLDLFLGNKYWEPKRDR